ncbi:hypothetical protein [Paenibacillus sp. 203]|uniref:hypothetical protein n=1 Tax=Paenibacillus sp. 203 TaxID=3096765 RepID=UPI001F3002F0|nr:hypothetical protein [Paenibacillus sp. UKAQ_18]
MNYYHVPIHITVCLCSSVGQVWWTFSDEYYFNRRFRQLTGIPPGKYALSVSGSVRVKDWTGHHIHIPRRASRIIYHGETMGDLLALGAKASGGSLRLSEYSVYKHRLVKCRRCGPSTGYPLDQCSRS